MTTQQKIVAFLDDQEECVIATTGEHGPEAATVGFSASQSLELMIGTTKDSRKFQNILRDPRVAVVVGFSGRTTVQYEGTARQLSGDELIERQEFHFNKLPEVKPYKDDPSQVYVSITPIWVRYSDFSQEQPVEELRRFA